MSETVKPARFGAFADLTSDEAATLKAMTGPTRRAPKGHAIHLEGDPTPELYFLLEGWAAASVNLPRGQRQYVKVHLPGDVMGAPSLAMTQAAETLTSLTPVSYAPIDLTALGHVFEKHPRLGALFFLAAQEERVLLMDRLASVGQLSAVERVAGFIMHLYDRLSLVYPNLSPVFDIPLTQEQMADAVGLTPVHVNRVIRQFDKEGVIHRRGHEFRLIDPEEFRKLSTLPERSVRRNAPWLPASKRQGVSGRD